MARKSLCEIPGGAPEAPERAAGERRSPSADVSPQALRQVGMEVLRKDLDPAAWARALVESQGSRDDAISQYARFRLAALVEEESECRGKRTNLEERRRDSFRDYRDVPVLPPVDSPERKLYGFMDALFWHLVAMVGLLGCVLAAGLLWPVLQLNFGWQILVVGVVAMQLIPALGWRAGRGVLHSVTYAQAAQMAACLAMVGSMALGFWLLQEPSPQESITLAREVPVDTGTRELNLPAAGEPTARGTETGTSGKLASTPED